MKLTLVKSWNFFLLKCLDMKYILSLKYSVSNNVIQVESTETINEITIQEEDEENIENFLADLKRLETVQDLNFRLPYFLI